MILGAIAVAAVATPSPQPNDPCGSIISIVTRPTITTSVCTVRPDHGLVENGYTNSVTTGVGGGTTINYPQSFVRFGVGRHMELAFSPPSFERTSLNDTLASGSSDMAFGAKWEIGYNAKAAWGAGFLISAPTGDPSFTAGATQYSGLINWSYTISPVFSAAGTVSFNSNSASNASGQFQQYSAFIPSLTITASLPGPPQQLFGEYVYYSHAGPALGTKSLIDVGYVRDFGEHVQFDIEWGFQPTVINGQKLHYFGAGLSLMN
ncbi:MAG: hypothetical protein JO322_15230 [Candidatus Eremiobacteraeota bacterium]|nr:hypothetical protein [Candidatus Eremiobacteraeota bacterium]